MCAWQQVEILMMMPRKTPKIASLVHLRKMLLTEKVLGFTIAVAIENITCNCSESSPVIVKNIRECPRARQACCANPGNLSCNRVRYIMFSSALEYTNKKTEKLLMVKYYELLLN